MTVQDKYEEQCILHEGWGGNSDMYEHMPVLKAYSRECNHITELGVRWVVSTWAFLAAKPQDLVCMDIVHPSHWGEEFRYRLDEVKKLSGDTNFKFIQADSLKVKLDPTDLLFIDTWHTYSQLTKELDIHAENVNKYIICHDTTSFADQGEDDLFPGIWKAIEEFLESNKGIWELKERRTNNNGLTVLQRVN